MFSLGDSSLLTMKSLLHTMQGEPHSSPPSSVRPASFKWSLLGLPGKESPVAELRIVYSE